MFCFSESAAMLESAVAYLTVHKGNKAIQLYSLLDP